MGWLTVHPRGFTLKKTNSGSPWSPELPLTPSETGSSPHRTGSMSSSRAGLQTLCGPRYRGRARRPGGCRRSRRVRTGMNPSSLYLTSPPRPAATSTGARPPCIPGEISTPVRRSGDEVPCRQAHRGRRRPPPFPSGEKRQRSGRPPDETTGRPALPGNPSWAPPPAGPTENGSTLSGGRTTEKNTGSSGSGGMPSPSRQKGNDRDPKVSTSLRPS